MVNVCVSWIDSFDLKRFAVNRENYNGSLIAFLDSEYYSNFDELYIIVSSKTKYFEFFGRFSKYIASKYSKYKKNNFFSFDLSSSPNAFPNITCALDTVAEKIKNDHSGKDINFNFHLGIGGFSHAVSSYLAWGQFTVYITYIDKITNKLVTKSNLSNNYDFDEASPHNFFSDYFSSNFKEEVIKEWGAIPEYEAIYHYGNKMSRILDKTHLLAQFDDPVIILGETGTGKELIAKAIHSSSRRSKGPTLSVNCAAIQPGLEISTLFGCVKGSHSLALEDTDGIFQKCDKGTIFLDEIGDISLEAQNKLLRVIEYGDFQKLGDNKTIKVNVRIISATSKDLKKLIEEKTFREDLFYRLAVGVIKLPSLRERDPKDIAIITKKSLSKINEKNRILVNDYIPKKMSESALEFICNYKWPGNIRELLNTLQRICILKEGELLSPEDIKENLLELSDNALPKDVTDILNDSNVNLKELTIEFRKKFILKALEITKGHQTKAAKLLGISQQTLSLEIKNLKKLNKW